MSHMWRIVKFMAKQNRTNHKLVQFKCWHSSICGLVYLARGHSHASHRSLWIMHKSMNSISHSPCWAVQTVQHKGNTINANNVQISVCIDIINPRLAVVSSTEKHLASWPQVLLLRLSGITCPWRVWNHVRLGCIITRRRHRVYILRWSDFQWIKSLKWSLEDARASIRLYPFHCTFTLPSAPGRSFSNPSQFP